MSEHGDRSRALLAAACRVIARRGVRGLRVEEVAREAEASTALIYYYFKNRRGLLAATVEFVDEVAWGYTDTSAGSARERLVAGLLREFQDVARVRENSTVWGELRASAVFDPELRSMVESATRRWLRSVQETVAAGQVEGSVPVGVDPAAMAIRLTALVEGLSNRWLAGLLSTESVHGLLRGAVAVELGEPESSTR